MKMTYIIAFLLIVGVAVAATSDWQHYLIIDMKTKQALDMGQEVPAKVPVGEEPPANDTHVWVPVTKGQFDQGISSLSATAIDAAIDEGLTKRSDYEEWKNELRLRAVVRLLLKEINVLRKELGLPERTPDDIKQTIKTDLLSD